jgi:di/tricarboxylate transporter
MMTIEIALVLSILAMAVVLFVTERLGMDVVALLVLGGLALSGLVTPAEALSGFSNPAVVTVWAVFILSGGLARTGVASVIGRQVLRLAGQGEVRLLVVIMLTAGLMSAFMNNVGVAALLLPVVMDIARRMGRPPSKLLMPLAFGSLLGGLMTLIGTPPNILASDALRDFGLQPFRLFDFLPVGLAVMLAGVAFMALVGRHLLPARDVAEAFSDPKRRGVGQAFDLREQLIALRLPENSALLGKTLAESRLGAALGLNIIGILRDGRSQLAPDPATVLQAGDRLLGTGSLDRLAKLPGQLRLIANGENLTVENLVSRDIEIAELGLSPRSSLLGQTLQQIDMRRRFGINVLAIWRDGKPRRTRLHDVALQLGDTLLVQGPRSDLEKLRESPDFLLSSAEVAEVYHLHERLLAVQIPHDSALVGKTLAESRLGDAFGLMVLGIVREGNSHLAPSASAKLMRGDTLLVEGDPADLLTLQGLQSLEIEPQAAPDLRQLETERVGLVEAILSPYTTLAGQTLSQLRFREKYALNVLAIFREGQTYRSNLRDMALQFGDALLLFGPRDKLKVLGREPDFIVLVEDVQEPPRLSKAPLAGLVMVGVLLPVIVGWLPISIAAVVGATLMVLLGCLTMEEAYRFIEWKAVFLIAGMLPLGIAMQQSGAAQFLAGGVVGAVGDLGPLVVMAGLFILTTLATQVMPNPAVTVLMAPIALTTAGSLNLSPYSLMMLVALSASASFLSPVAHPANVLIMGPGGYRFVDYLRVGLPLTLVTLVVVLLVLPIFWPLAA